MTEIVSVVGVVLAGMMMFGIVDIGTIGGMKITYISFADRIRRNRQAGFVDRIRLNRQAGRESFDFSDRLELARQTLFGIKSLQIVVGEINGCEHVYYFPVVSLLESRDTGKLKFRAIPSLL